jgi:hypothetical protein
MKSNRRRESAYAIVRLDDFFLQLDDVHVLRAALRRMRDWITITQIVRSPEEARAEVERLNRLHGPDGCLYFAQRTRLGPEEPRVREGT